MKHNEYFREWEPALVGLAIDVPELKNKNQDVGAFKKYSQTVGGSDLASDDQSFTGKINNCCLYILVLAISDAFGKVRVAIERNNLTREVLRKILLVTTKITPSHQQLIQSLTTTLVNLSNLCKITSQLKTVVAESVAHVHAISVTSDAVVYTLWSCIFSLWQPY